MITEKITIKLRKDFLLEINEPLKNLIKKEIKNKIKIDTFKITHIIEDNFSDKYNWIYYCTIEY